MTNAGSHIDSCIREAVILAITDDRTVNFYHNGTLYTVKSSEIISNIYNASH